MNIKAFRYAVSIVAVMALAVGIGALAQNRRPVHFSGLVNDYSPSNVKGGP